MGMPRPWEPLASAAGQLFPNTADASEAPHGRAGTVTGAAASRRPVTDQLPPVSIPAQSSRSSPAPPSRPPSLVVGLPTPAGVGLLLAPGVCVGQEPAGSGGPGLRNGMNYPRRAQVLSVPGRPGEGKSLLVGRYQGFMEETVWGWAGSASWEPRRCRPEDDGSVRPAGGQGEAGRQTRSRSFRETFLGGQGAGTAPALVGGGVPEGSEPGMAPSELGQDHGEHEDGREPGAGGLRWGLSPGPAWTRERGWEERTSSRH